MEEIKVLGCIIYSSKTRVCEEDCNLYYKELKLTACKYNSVYMDKRTSEHLVEPVKACVDNCVHYDYLKKFKKTKRRNLVCKILLFTKNPFKKAVNE